MSSEYEILVANPSHDIDDLREVADVKVGNPPDQKPNTEDELIELAKSVDAILITSREWITRRVIESAPSLQIVMKYGAQPDPEKVDYEAATENDVIIGYTEGANSDSVAEFTILLMLATARRLQELSERVEAGGWRGEGLDGFEIKDKRLGLVGFGSVGRHLAEKIDGFGMDLLAYDPYIPANEIAPYGQPVDELDDLLRDSDIVSVHCPLTEETRHLLGEREFALMDSDSIVINTARGAVIDEEALADAMRNGELFGAGIDVYSEEPPDRDYPLLGLPNVVTTPHMAGVSREASERERDWAHEGVLKALRGEPPDSVANPEVLE